MAKNDSLRQEQRKNAMMTDSVPRAIFKMAIPTIVAFIINSVYSLADTYFVSSLGTNATAAVSVNASLDQIIMLTGSLFAVGGSSYISRLLGAREDEKATEVLSTSFFLATAFSSIIMVVGFIFMRPIMTFLGATATCEQYAIDYATYVLLAAPFMATSFVMNLCLRSEGNAILSMVGMGFGGILNGFLDPFFIFTLDLGVAGASIATAISRFVSFAILIFPYLTRRSLLCLSIRKFKPTRKMLVEIISIGSSSLLRALFGVISAIVLNNIAGDISDSVLAGIGVATKVMLFPFNIILGFGNGFQPVAGFNWGAKQFDRVRHSFLFASATAVVGAVVMGLGLGIFADQAILLFAGDDPFMREIGALSIRLQCIALPAQGWCTIVNLMCAGLGRARGAILLSSSRQGTCFLPFVHVVTHFFGAYGVAAIQAAADIIALCLAFPIAHQIMKQVNAAEQAHLCGAEVPL